MRFTRILAARRLVTGCAALALLAAPLAAAPLPSHAGPPPSPVRVTTDPPATVPIPQPGNHTGPGATRDAPQAVAPPTTVTVRIAPPRAAPSGPGNLFVPPAPADITLSKDGATIYLVGIIGDGSFLKFAKLARSAKGLRRVYLASTGGLTIEGRLLGSMVRKMRLDTYVEFVCASACTQIYAAGKERVAGPRARIGFHQASFMLGDGTELTEDKVLKGLKIEGPIAPDMVIGVGGNAMMRMAYQLAGFAPPFIDRALATPPSGMWYPGLDELVANKVVTRRATSGEVGPPGGTSRTFEPIRMDLLASPLWTALQAKDPQKFEDLAGDVWRFANSGYSMAMAKEQVREKFLDEQEGKLRLAPDALLDRYLSFYREFAQFERARDYRDCARSEAGSNTSDAELADYNGRNDALAADLIANASWVPELSDSEARKQIKAAAKSLLRTVDLSPAAESSDKRDCRIGLQSFETIAALDTRQRIKSFRALLTLIAMRQDAKDAPAPIAPIVAAPLPAVVAAVKPAG